MAAMLPGLSFAPVNRRGAGAFSLLEVLVVCALLAVIFVTCYSVIGGTTSAWATHKARLSSFEKARVGFELLTNRLAQATLNTYWDYDNPTKPLRYLRKSELHFILGDSKAVLGLPAQGGVTAGAGQAVFFTAPLGFTSATAKQPLVKMLTACGFFVAFSDEVERPDFLPAIPRYRFRLYQYLQPGENLAVYKEPGNQWFTSGLIANAYPMVDNVIGLILRANYPGKTSDITEYEYDSRNGTPANPTLTYNQLPPSISVTMVVLDESSAVRLIGEQTVPPVIFPEDLASPFTEIDDYETDLKKWTDWLAGQKLNFRVFTADVPIRGAKWSSD